MKRFCWLICVLVFNTGFVPAQVLKPSIGLSALPSDNDKICKIPYYLGSFDKSGYIKGDTVPDFTLYDLAGAPFNLKTKLATGKAVLLVAGNYTCFVYRDKVADINAIKSQYGNQVQIAVIYGVEAHPTDTSPYFARVNTNQRNYDDNVLYKQPLTYGERKNIANDMIIGTGVNVPVYLDGPCNEWWLNFGPAPNNAYLIDTTGRVFAKHDWFDRLPGNDIEKDIRNLLGLPPKTNNSTNGSFTISIIDSIGHGIGGNTIDSRLIIINPDTSAVLIDMARLQEDIPAGWLTSMCTDICYNTDEDRDSLFLESGDTIVFYMHFYTSPVIIKDSGTVVMGFKNVNIANNKYQLRLYATAEPDPASSLNETKRENRIAVFPNPFENYIEISGLNPDEKTKLELSDLHGKVIYEQAGSNKIYFPDQLRSGIYFLRIIQHDRSEMQKLIKM